MIRFLTAGESHGPGLVAIVEGLPAGIVVSRPELSAELARRRLGHGRGPRMALEQDDWQWLGGVRFGRTLGGPVAVVIGNTEWPRWSEEMSPEAGFPARRLTAPRPGHADLAGMLKYDTHDARDILERASARETAARAVAGYLCARLLDGIGVDVLSHVVAIGGVAAPDGPLPRASDRAAIDASPVRVFDRSVEQPMIDAIDAAKAARDTLGGVVEVVAHRVPPGLGSHVHWDRKIDGRLAGALMSIPAIKAVEVGDGVAGAGRSGSAAHDEIEPGEGGFRRATRRAGGVEGGITTGEPLRVRAHMKPLSTLMRPLGTVDVDTKVPEKAIRERSDVCAVPAAGIVAEHMVEVVLADEAMRKFGGDTIADFAHSANAYRRRVEEF
ncbi:MAG: chorismate synthase [Actinomycetota bacterium]|nr:chorismate synthase [Actinomycetota bacterium]